MADSLSRRQLLGRAAGAAATLVVSQSIMGCSSSTENDGGEVVDGCVLTASLTEGPYFVDERLNRSDIRADPTTGAGATRRFLRGYQITDASGVAHFTTIYPGWYMGRAVHVHFKLRLIAGATTTYEFTSQFFFNESVTDTVHALAPYSSKGPRDTRNSNDGIYNGLSSSAREALTLQTSQNGAMYSGIIDLSVRVG